MTSVAQLLIQEVRLVQQFIDSLNTEQESLKQGKVDSLGTINSQRVELVQQLNTIERERNAFLVQSGHTGDRKGMQAWLVHNRGDRTAVAGWAKLMQLARQAQDLNNLNGQLIAIRLQATQQALVALTRQPQRPTLYGRDGHTMQRTGSRIIDAA